MRFNIAMLATLALAIGLVACKDKKKDEAGADTKDSVKVAEKDTATLPPASYDSIKNAVQTIVVKEKIGYLNSALLLDAMPEAKAARKKLEGIYASNKSKYEGLMQTYQQKGKSLQENAQLLNEKEQESRILELQGLEKQLGELEQSTSEAMAKEEEKLLAPIKAKADRIVKQVALENGFTFIMDPSLGGIVYADSTRDILPLVKAKMGLPADRKK